MVTIARSLEDRVREELADGEELEYAFEGIRSRWLPWSWLGEFFAQPCAVALTSRRVLVFEVPRASRSDASIEQDVRRSAVRARFKRIRRLQWTPLQGSWSRLDLALPDAQVTVYVDRTARDAASAFASAVNGDGSPTA